MTTRRRAAAAGGNSSAAKTARIEMVEMSEFDMGMGIKEEPLSLFNFVDVNDCVEPSANKTNTPISTNQYPDSNINFHENIKVIAEIMQKLLDKMEHHEVETDRRFTVQNILMNKIIKQNEKLLNTSRQERIEHGSAALDNLLDAAELASLNEPTTNPQAAKETPRGLTNTQITAPESTQPPDKSLSSMPVKKNVKPVTITTTNGNVLQKVNLAEVLGTANSSASLKKITELTQKVDQLNNSILEIKKMEVLNYGAFNMNTSNQINSEFPLDSVEAVLKMEKSLADEQKYIEVRNMFNCYSESLEKKFKAMFSDNSIKNFTYNGFMDLLPLSSNKRLMEILKSTTNIICTQFEREVSSFIIRAKGRLKKKKSRNRDVFQDYESPNE